MNHWTVSHSSDGFKVHIEKVPTWAYLIETGFEVFEDKVLRACMGNPPEVLWKVPTTSLKRDETLSYDGSFVFEKSLAERLIDAHSWVLNMTHRNKRCSYRPLPVSDALGEELWGPNARYWEDDDDDDDA